MTFAQALAFTVTGIGCFFLGMCQEHRAMKLKQCEPIKDRAAYEECLKHD